jgi:ABC-type transporter Mla subunit MlaD
MRAMSSGLLARTAFTLGYLLALVLAGRGTLGLLAGAGLLVVWLAPLAGRSRGPAAVTAPTDRTGSLRSAG